jgi:CheY-like chemotaxis protein
MKMKALKILLAEDNVDHAELMTDTLCEFNPDNEIFHVDNGEKALQFLRAESPYEHAFVPDLIMLDLKMPRMDGMTLLKIVKRDEAIKNIPLLIVSTSTEQREVMSSFELGANSYITKPLQFEEFSRKIRDLNAYWVRTIDQLEQND